MLKLFNLSPNKIKLHNEISTEPTDCPGEFFEKAVMVAMIRKFIVK